MSKHLKGKIVAVRVVVVQLEHIYVPKHAAYHRASDRCKSDRCRLLCWREQISLPTARVLLSACPSRPDAVVALAHQPAISRGSGQEHRRRN